MKSFRGNTYYDVLQIAPTATVYEVRQAYSDASSLYSDESLATYGMFDEAQRQEIQNALDDAFATLVDDQQRRAYNQELIESGRIDPEMLVPEEPKRTAIVFEAPASTISDTLDKKISMRTSDPKIRQMVRRLGTLKRIRGGDLKQVRDALGVSMEEIYDATRISVSTIEAIETDKAELLPSSLYLKNFLKAYASLLGMDPQHIMTGYLKNIGRN
jgi:hypothetical protein